MVCSLQKVTAGSHNYYTEVIAKDDYYKEGGEAEGRYLGKGARTLGLAYRTIGYKDSTLRKLFLGHDQHGRCLRSVSLTVRESETARGTTVKHYPTLGWDFTFSAPKSVSVLWSQADRVTRCQIEACHKMAVHAAVSVLEEKGIYTRTGRGGETRVRVQPIFAAFPHTLSRAQDPQLHDHVILLNTGIRDNGKGGAIDARTLFPHIHTLGLMYRNELRYRLERELGVMTVDRPVGKAQGFEIAGVPADLITEMSKRTRAIEARVSELQKTLERDLTPHEVQAVKRETRAVKEYRPREELFQGWREVGERHGFSYTQVIQKQKEKPFSQADAKDLIREVSKSLSYRTSINDRDVLNAALKSAKGTLDTHAVHSFTRSYRDAFLEATHLHNNTLHYTLNKKGHEAASYQSLYLQTRRKINTIVRKVLRAGRAIKSALYTYKEESFQRRIKFSYVTGQISKRTYTKLTTTTPPKSRAEIEFRYATYQISKKARNYYLKQIDPTTAENRKKWEEAKEVRDFLRTQKTLRIKELYRKELISRTTRDALLTGTMNLSAVERDLIRRSPPAPKNPPTDDRTLRDPERDRP